MIFCRVMLSSSNHTVTVQVPAPVADSVEGFAVVTQSYLWFQHRMPALRRVDRDSIGLVSLLLAWKY
jgi:hypothetical protein